MKSILFSAIIIFSAISLPTHANDELACAMFMCAYGEEEGGGCAGPISKLRGIIGKKHGHFSCSRTKSKRLTKLLACKEADKGQVKEAATKIGCER